MTDQPTDAPGPVDDLLPAADGPVPPYTDPVEEQGVRFAREADSELPGPATDVTGRPGDLTPDFIAPHQPS